MISERNANVHIAKTAGTSRSEWYVETYGADRVLAYNVLTDRFRRMEELRSVAHPGLFQLKERLIHSPLRPVMVYLTKRLSTIPGPNDLTWRELPEADYDVITGHYTADKLNGLPEHVTSVVLREPLSRMYSQYCHWIRGLGTTRFRYNATYNNKMSFEQFALLEDHQNYQSIALGGISLEQFDVVGTTQNLDLYIKQLSSRLGVPASKLSYKNRAEYKPALEVSDEFKETFKDLNQVDYNLYEQAKMLVL